MNEKEKRKVLLMAMQMSGLQNPLSQVVEAAAEMIIAAQHVQQKREGYVEDLAEHIAVMELLLEQLRITASGLADRVDGEKILKLERMKKNMCLAGRDN